MPACGNLPGEGGFSDALEDLFGGPNHYNKIRDASIPPPPGALMFNTGTYVVHTVQTAQGAWHPSSNFGMPMGQHFAASSNSTGLAPNAPIPPMPASNQLYQQKPE
ncbi:hypothetical protein WR25_08282 [Diploscapter pachys]|uniref:Uncharacterized protein n=1 Tax=Diploscapter pachys TaxID=2018661 RepID=A0A2A2LHR6_9BILA|nr:hypothetical protein WR25_08282 [Diploscapter pachys]